MRREYDLEDILAEFSDHSLDAEAARLQAAEEAMAAEAAAGETPAEVIPEAEVILQEEAEPEVPEEEPAPEAPEEEDHFITRIIALSGEVLR